MVQRIVVERFGHRSNLEYLMPRTGAISYIIRHWFPIFTFCPVNNLPDLIYVTLRFDDGVFRDLYKVRKAVRKSISGRTAYMEDLAHDLSEKYPTAIVTVRLALDRHVVIIHPKDGYV